MTTPTPADLSTCDSEPIHIPGAVQPHGVLLVLREKDLEVIQVSANTEVHLALRPADIIGKRLGAIFRQHIADQVLAATRLRHEQLRSMYLPSLLEHNGRRWTAFLSRSEGGLQLELEPDPYPQSDGAPDLHARLRNAVASLDSAETVTDFCQRAAETLRDLVRFDRVLVYQFLQDDSGMVRAEARREDLDTYLGLHYPASDIPQQARNLYLLNPFRLTVDVDAPPAPLVPVRNPITGGDLDLTFCALRATSPVHLEYLRNMGVAASMSLSIVREGRLWGLFACHHQSPRTVSHEVRVAAELLARLTSLQVASREAREQAGYVSVLTTVREQLAEKLTASGDFAAALTHGRNTLLTHIDASGAALCTGSKVILLGETPAREEVIELAGWLSSAHPEPIWSTDRLSLDYGPADDFRSVASGVLAMRVTDEGKEAVLWFRPEWLRTVSSTLR